MTTPSEQRRSVSSAAAGETASNNSANIATNTATNAGLSALLGTLPGPLSVAATALSEGISAAIKTSASQARSVPPSAPSLADPTKIFAAQLAFAIITAIWCFIKSILNPLPIIGMFFPLCSEEDRSRNVTALANATANTQLQQPLPQQTVPLQPNNNQIPEPATLGISFEQFLAANRTSSRPDRTVAQPRQSTQQQTNVVTQGTQQPAIGIQEIINQPSATVNTVNSPNDVRKLFGL